MEQAVARDLALERGFSKDVVSAFSVQANGAGWKWQTSLLGGGQATRWKSFFSRRPEGDTAWAKYKWIPSKPDDAIFLYPPGRSLADEIARGGGRLYLAGGEPAAMSLMSANRWNSTSLFGDGLIPENLGDLLRALGVKTLFSLADRDQSGLTWAGRIRDRLIPFLDIDYRPLALPYPLLEKHGQDVNDLWLEVLDTTPGEDDPCARFLELIDGLEELGLPEPERKTAPDMDYGLAPLDLPVEFLQAIEIRLEVDHGFKNTGWTKKPVRCPFHDDQHPSANWNRHLGILHCFSGCGKTYLAKEVGEAFGLRLKDYLPTAARVPLAASEPQPALPAGAPAPKPAPILVTTPKRGLRPPLPASAALTDADLALAATGRGWLDDYIAFAAEASPLSPTLFHEALGLFLLSTISTRRVYLPSSPKAIFPNLYFMIVARTTVYGKTSAIIQAERVLKEARLEYLLLPTDSSTEALFDNLAGLPHSNEDDLPPEDRAIERRARWFAAQRAILIDEASSFFKLAAKDYGSGLPEMLLKGYDETPRWTKSLKSRGLIVVRNLCLSFAGATTPIYAGKYFANEEMESGLGARFVFITPDSGPKEWRRFAPIGVPSAVSDRLAFIFRHLLPNDLNEIRGRLTTDELLDSGPPPGHVWPVLAAQMTPAAAERTERYGKALHGLACSDEGAYTPQMYGRLTVTMSKVALLLALAELTTRTASLVIEERHALAAIEVCERWRESYHRMMGDVAQATASKVDEKVLTALRQAGRDGLTPRDLMRGVGLKDKRAVEDILLLLAEDGLIERFPRPPRGNGKKSTNAFRVVEDAPMPTG